jgi:hypothetical protein
LQGLVLLLHFTLLARPGLLGLVLTALACGMLAEHFVMALVPGKSRRSSPVESWSSDDDMTIAASTVLEHAFLMGLAGCAAVVVAGVATTAWRIRHRAVLLACCYPVLLFLPCLLFHDGFLD